MNFEMRSSELSHLNWVHKISKFTLEINTFLHAFISLFTNLFSSSSGNVQKKLWVLQKCFYFLNHEIKVWFLFGIFPHVCHLWKISRSKIKDKQLNRLGKKILKSDLWFIFFILDFILFNSLFYTDLYRKWGSQEKLL